MALDLPLVAHADRRVSWGQGCVGSYGWVSLDGVPDMRGDAGSWKVRIVDAVADHPASIEGMGNLSSGLLASENRALNDRTQFPREPSLREGEGKTPGHLLFVHGASMAWALLEPAGLTMQKIPHEKQLGEEALTAWRGPALDQAPSAPPRRSGSEDRVAR